MARLHSTSAARRSTRTVRRWSLSLASYTGAACLSLPAQSSSVETDDSSIDDTVKTIVACERSRSVVKGT